MGDNCNSLKKYIKRKKVSIYIGLKEISKKVEELKILSRAKKHNKIEYKLLLLERELYQMRKHEKIALKILYSLRNNLTK